MIKRYLRRKRINEYLRQNKPIPKEITAMDLGYHLYTNTHHINTTNDPIVTNDDDKSLVPTPEQLSINLKQGLGLFRAARPLQRTSQKYWMFEYIRRLMLSSSSSNSNINITVMECIVLGCTDYERNQYAVYIPQLGLEHKYLSEMGPLKDGQRIWLKVASVNPRMLYLTLTLAQKPQDHSSYKIVNAAA